MRYLAIMKLKKITLKILLEITIDEHLNFNKNKTKVCKSASKKLNALLWVSFALSYQQKKVVSNSFISWLFNYYPLIWIFSSIRSYRKIIKLYARSLRLCHNDYISSYGKLLSKQSSVNIHIRNIQHLMLVIFQCLKGISPHIINEVFTLSNIPYTMRILRDLESQLTKTVYWGLKTIACKATKNHDYGNNHLQK